MIMHTSIRLQPGEIVRGGTMTDYDDNEYIVTFKVVREATREEYIEFLGDKYNPRFWLGKYFYEVQMD